MTLTAVHMPPVSRQQMLFDHEPLRKTFFQQVGNPLFQKLIDHWAAQTPPVIIDLGIKIKGATPNDLLIKWHEWVPANPVLASGPDQDLRCINDVGRRKAEFLLTPAANRAGLAFDLILQKIAMQLYLDHPGEFWAAYNGFYACKLGAHRHFRGKKIQALGKADVEAKLPQLMTGLDLPMKLARYEPPIDTDVTEDATQTFILLSYPYLKEGVRKLNSQSGKAEYSEDRFIRDAMILFENVHGTMKMKFGRSSKLIDAVRKLLGEIYFGDPEWFSAEFSLDLTPLADPAFGNTLPAASPFKSLTVTELTFTANGSDSILAITHDDGVWNLFDQVYKVRPSDIAPQSAKLVFEMHSGGRDKVVKLTLPNHTSLDETPKDNQAEQLLRDLGIILGGPRTLKSAAAQSLYSDSQQ